MDAAKQLVWAYICDEISLNKKLRVDYNRIFYPGSQIGLMDYRDIRLDERDLHYLICENDYIENVNRTCK